MKLRELRRLIKIKKKNIKNRKPTLDRASKLHNTLLETYSDQFSKLRRGWLKKKKHKTKKLSFEAWKYDGWFSEHKNKD